MKTNRLLITIIILTVTVSFVGCASNQKRKSAPERAAEDYVVAVSTGDMEIIDYLEPSAFPKPESSALRAMALFNTPKVSKIEILGSSILDEDDYSEATLPDAAPVNVMRVGEGISMTAMQNFIRASYKAKKVSFYAVDVRETSGKKRTMKAYVTLVEDADGVWRTLPGISINNIIE